MRGDRRFYSPPWMCPAWAAESDAYKLLFQEIYSAHDVRMSRLVVGGGAIAMQALVLILVLRHLHHKMVRRREARVTSSPRRRRDRASRAGLLAHSRGKADPRARGPLRGVRHDDGARHPGRHAARSEDDALRGGPRGNRRGDAAVAGSSVDQHRPESGRSADRTNLVHRPPSTRARSWATFARLPSRRSVPQSGSSTSR